MKKIFIASILILLFAGIIPAETQGQGLVPCGQEGNPCKLCHFFVLLKNIIDFVLAAVGVIAVLMLTIGGVMFLFAGGNPGTLENAKKILFSTAIGMLITFGSWLIINSVLTFPNFVSANFDLNNWYDPSSWFQSTCP